MNKTTVFAVTDLGKALLEKPQGKISGDARLVMGLIDGKASVGEIIEKTPPSVRIHLTGIFDRLLNYGVIEEKGIAGPGIQAGKREQAAKVSAPQPSTAITPPAVTPPAAGARATHDAEIENMRRLELERELEDVRSKLEATIARQKKVEDDYARLTQQVSTFTQAKQEDAADATRARPAHSAGGSHVSPENMKKLNQALLEKQEILGNTLRLRAYQAKLAMKRHDEEFETGEEAKEAQLHPRYKSLRGLEFFRGFSNKELVDFLTIAKWRGAKDGDVILNEGEVGMSFYIIISGKVDVFRKDNLLMSLGRGDFFGEFAYLSGEEPVRSARVVATSDCELLVVEPLDIEFSPVHLRLRVVEALLRGEVRRALLSDQRIDSLSKDLE